MKTTTELIPVSEAGRAALVSAVVAHDAAVSGWILPEDMASLASDPALRPARSARPASAGLPGQRRSSSLESVTSAAGPQLLVAADRGSWTAPPPRSKAVVGASVVAGCSAVAAPAVVAPVVDTPAASFAALLPIEPHATADALLPVGESWMTRLRRPVLALVAAGLVMVGTGAPTFGDDMKSLTLDVDGAPRTITTTGATVADALASVGIPVHEHDIVAPAATTTIADGAAISLRRGRLITADVDGKKRQLWTTANSVDAALHQLGLDNGDYQVAADRSRPIGTDGLTVSGHRLHAVTVVDGATPAKKLRAPGLKVADVLTAQGISLAATDTVTPAVGAAVADGTKIIVTRIAVKNRAVEQKIARPADVSVPNAALGKGDSKVTNPGKDGLRRVTIQRTVINGKASEKVVANTVLRTPQAKVVSVGTKETGAPESWSVPWDKMAFCESTSRWSVNTGNGTYGGLQFMTPTWLEYGGGEFAPRADLATEAQQIIVAERLYAKEGLAPWHCARLLGWGFGKYQG